jgi:hypothetical protein
VLSRKLRWEVAIDQKVVFTDEFLFIASSITKLKTLLPQISATRSMSDHLAIDLVDQFIRALFGVHKACR